MSPKDSATPGSWRQTKLSRIKKIFLLTGALYVFSFMALGLVANHIVIWPWLEETVIYATLFTVAVEVLFATPLWALSAPEFDNVAASQLFTQSGRTAATQLAARRGSEVRHSPKVNYILLFVRWISAGVFCLWIFEMAGAGSEVSSTYAPLLGLIFVPAGLGTLAYALLLLGPAALLATLSALRSPGWMAARLSESVGSFTALGFALGFARIIALATNNTHPDTRVGAVDTLINFSLIGALVGTTWGCVNICSAALQSDKSTTAHMLSKKLPWWSIIGPTATIILPFCAVTVCYITYPQNRISPEIFSQRISSDYMDAAKPLIRSELEKMIRSTASQSGLSTSDVGREVSRRVDQEMATIPSSIQSMTPSRPGILVGVLLLLAYGMTAGSFRRP